ncbi:MAG: hypothetical protein RL701_6022, partial [Pseudomonadota bacterium]
MMRLDLSVSLFLLCLCLGSARADATSECAGSVLITDSLTQSECSSQDGITVSQFVGATPSSPYATEFDRRTVAVVRGHDAKSVRQAAGFVNGSRGIALPQSRLARPPAEDQIARRVADRATSRYRKWTVMTEKIQYGAQGGAPGFVLDCATALRSNQRETTA